MSHTQIFWGLNWERQASICQEGTSSVMVRNHLQKLYYLSNLSVIPDLQIGRNLADWASHQDGVGIGVSGTGVPGASGCSSNALFHHCNISLMFSWWLFGAERPKNIVFSPPSSSEMPTVQDRAWEMPGSQRFGVFPVTSSASPTASD